MVAERTGIEARQFTIGPNTMTTTPIETIPEKTRDARRGLDVESLKRSFINHVAFTLAKVPGYATKHDRYIALATTVRDRLIDRWIATRNAYYNRPDLKRAYYLSLEFLIGRTLGNSLVNLNLYDECHQALFGEAATHQGIACRQQGEDPR